MQGLLSSSVDVKYDFVEIDIVFSHWQQNGRHGTFNIFKQLETHKKLKKKFDKHRAAYPGYVTQVGYFQVSPNGKNEVEQAVALPKKEKAVVPKTNEIICISDSDDEMI